MNIIAQAPPANDGTTLNIFLGKNKEEQTESLQDIKDAIVDVMFACLNQDSMLDEKTHLQLQAIYLLADRQVKKMKSNRYKD